MDMNGMVMDGMHMDEKICKFLYPDHVRVDGPQFHKPSEIFNVIPGIRFLTNEICVFSIHKKKHMVIFILNFLFLKKMEFYFGIIYTRSFMDFFKIGMHAKGLIFYCNF